MDYMPDSVRDVFEDPDHDLAIGEQAFDLIMTAREPDKLALIYLPVFALIANRMIQEWDESAGEPLAETGDIMNEITGISIETLIPLLLTGNPSDRGEFFDSSVYCIQKVSTIMAMVAARHMDPLEVPFINTLVEQSVREIVGPQRTN